MCNIGQICEHSHREGDRDSIGIAGSVDELEGSAGAAGSHETSDTDDQEPVSSGSQETFLIARRTTACSTTRVPAFFDNDRPR